MKPLFNPAKLKEIQEREAVVVDRPKVMLVDDEPANLRMMAALLERDYELVEAQDGQLALDLLDTMSDRESLTCIVSDQRMPRVTGVELFERIHTALPRVIRIIVTGFIDVDAIIDSINRAEIYKFIVKPFDANDFKLTVKRAVEAFQMQRQIEIDHRELAAAKSELEAANAELAAQNEAIHRFVPSEFLRHLDRPSLLEVQLGDNVLREMTVLFADIMDFSSLSEQMQPQENFDFLNSYLSRVGPLIRRHGGFVDKYLGDGVMGLFPNSRRDALDAAIDFRRELVEYNAGRARAGYVPIDVGIGVHSGVLMLGTIGEAQRMDTTVISDAVNVAARLESLTRVYRVGAIVSEAVTARLGSRASYALRPLGAVRIKGRSASVAIYELFDADEPALFAHKQATSKAFAAAIEAYRNGTFKDAGRAFAEISAGHAGDGAAQYYSMRCAMMQSNVPQEWSGVEVFEVK